MKKSVKKRYLCRDGKTIRKYYGLMGHPIGYSGFCVGDIVMYTHHMGTEFEETKISIIAYDDVYDCYSIWGWFGQSLANRIEYGKVQNVRKVISNNLVTQEILDELFGDRFTIREPKPMTKREIEEILGYEIEVVEEDGMQGAYCAV